MEPFFFEEPDGNSGGALRTVTVNGQRYERLLSDHVLPVLQSKPEEVKTALIFQQDGAPPHIFRPVKDLLRNFFGSRVISRHFPDEWPPRSPGLNPLDFWLWGYLGSRVFQRAPKSIQELRKAIRDEISVITPEQLSDAVDSFHGRVLAVIENNGGHFEQMR